jgi:hypothetical protein
MAGTRPAGWPTAEVDADKVDDADVAAEAAAVGSGWGSGSQSVSALRPGLRAGSAPVAR